ncbi:glycosyltransferase [Epilithonimonas sp.]|uniref:glycosyltransferase n=1 Tax=Epilithonimonas sp. TaxID=2894511 RepID=UPI0028B154B1|nr:glycosyltransferase [Epilithonimonas sp.]
MSIIIPVYDVENLLPKCLNSIYEQDFSLNEFEVILINDASNDNSLKVALQYASQYNNIQIINQKNSGQSVARNKGLAAIWWSGLYLAKLYISNVKVTYKSLLLPFCSLGIITLVLSVNFLVIDKNTFLQAGALSALSILEFRHFLFSLVILFVLPLWTKFNWFGFDVLLGWFKYVASFSFVIYISHWFLVYDARYLDFIAHKDLRLVNYIVFYFLT